MSRKIELQGLNNTRDLGGMLTADGNVIRNGVLIRSGQLYSATCDDKEWLQKHVELIVDFRTERERSEKPDPVIENMGYLHLPIFESLAAGVSRDKKSDDEAFRMVAVDPDRARDYMNNTYAGFTENEFSRSQYGRFIRLLLKHHEKAVLWHCTAGKDRAGFASVIVQEMLGIPYPDIVEDYLKTNEYLKAEIQQLNEMVGNLMGGLNGTTERALDYLFGAHEEYLVSVYDVIQERYGGFDRFIRDGLGISDEERKRFQNAYLEHAF